MLFRLHIPLLIAVSVVALTTPGARALPSTDDRARVIGVHRGESADLVLVVGGFDFGLRQGMLCSVSRDGLNLAEVLITEARASHCSALIVKCHPNRAIRKGDSVSVKSSKTLT